MTPQLASLINAADAAGAVLAAAKQAVADATAKRDTAAAALKQVESDLHTAVAADYGDAPVEVAPVVAEAATEVETPVAAEVLPS